MPGATGENFAARSGLLLPLMGSCLEQEPQEKVRPRPEPCVGQRRRSRHERSCLVLPAGIQRDHPRGQERALRPPQHRWRVRPPVAGAEF